VLRRIYQLGHLPQSIVEADRVLELLEAEHRLYFHLNGQDDARAPEPTQGGHEEIVMVLPGASHSTAVGKEKGHGLHMGRQDAIRDAGSMCGGRDDSS
jgi:hypothetical protein